MITKKDIQFDFILPLRYEVRDGKDLYIKTKDSWLRLLKGKSNLYNICSQDFGANAVPFYKELGWKGHNGKDLLAPTGANLYSMCDGTVTKISESWGAITIETDEFEVNGKRVKLQITYGHNQETTVEVGDKVIQGQLIGYTDNKGQYTTGSHLHVQIDPLYLNSRDRWYKDYSNGYAGSIDFDLDTLIKFKQPMKYLKTLREIVDEYISAGGVLGVTEKDFEKIKAGDETLINRIKTEHKGMFFRAKAQGQFYVLE